MQIKSSLKYNPADSYQYTPLISDTNNTNSLPSSALPPQSNPSLPPWTQPYQVPLLHVTFYTHAHSYWTQPTIYDDCYSIYQYFSNCQYYAKLSTYLHPQYHNICYCLLRNHTRNYIYCCSMLIVPCDCCSRIFGIGIDRLTVCTTSKLRCLRYCQI